jgi:hypothetical protein
MHTIMDSISFLVLSCFREPLGQSVGRVVDCLRNAGLTCTVENGGLDLRRVYFPHPQRGGAEPVRVVMWSPQNLPEITAFYANSSDGWSTLINCLSSAGLPECISVRSTVSPEKWSVQEVRVIASGNRVARSLQLIEEDDGMVFHQEGIPFDFEDLSVGPRKRIATRKEIVQFVGNLGINLDDTEFWTTSMDAIYLSEEWTPMT